LSNQLLPTIVRKIGYTGYSLATTTFFIV
jgi:hypothetical protein